MKCDILYVSSALGCAGLGWAGLAGGHWRREFLFVVVAVVSMRTYLPTYLPHR